ncbi:MAG: acyl carrier protein [Bacteroidales bacterium]|jgi:acyl carrier protein
MERTELVSKLTAVFRKVFKNNSLNLTNELTANDVDNWDSLSHMLLITEIENTFSIKFKLKDLNKMRKVGDMIDIIMSKL